MFVYDCSVTAAFSNIFATINDTDIQRRVLGIFAKIMHHEKVNLVGQTVSSAQEVAILAQAFRNPLIEVFRTLYIRDGKIVAHDGFTLNSSQMTRSDALRIRERMRENKADSFYILHNHPTAIARFSSADITASHGIHAMFGDQYKGQIVVDSGTYAKITYEDTGRFDRQEELILSPDDIGWDTSKDPDLHGIRSDDPLYKDFTPEAIEKFKAMYPKHDVYDAWRLSDSPRKGPAPDFSNQEDAPKAIAALGKYLQTRKDWFVVVGMGNTGYITLMTEFTGLMELAEAGKLKEFLYENLDTLGADIFHIIATGGQPVKDALTREFGNSQNPTGLAAGVASIWVDGDSLGIIKPVPTSPQIPAPEIKEGRETEYVTQPPADDSTPEPEDESDTDDDTEQSPTNTGTTENIIEAILDAVNAGAFSDDGDIMEVDVDGVGLVEISIEDDVLAITSDAGHDLDIEIPESLRETFLNDDISMEELVSLTLAAEAQQSSEQSDIDYEPEDDPNAEEAERQAREDMGDEGIIEFEKTSADPADAPDPADESAVIHIMPNPDDFDRETRDNTGFQRALNKFTDAASGIRQILGLASRQGARITRKTISSGFGILEEISKTDQEGADKIGDHIRKNILRRQFISKSQFARDAARLLPILKEFDTYINKKATPTLTSKVTPQQVTRRNAVRQRVNDVVWRYIEDNREIKDPELLEIAKKMKEAWREMLIEGTHTMLELTDELKDVLNETIFITDSTGNKVPWYPEEFDGFIWDADAKKFKRNEGTAKNPKWVQYTIEEAHRKAKRLYTPHYFYHNKLRQQHRILKKLIEDMNTLIKSDNPAADPNKLLSIGIKHDSAAGDFIFLPDGRLFDNVLEALEHAVAYWTERELSMRGLLEYTDAGLRAERYGQQAPGGAMDDPRIGAYGHLERARETDDKFYKRDLRLLLETRRLLWDRVGEFATVGQIHPIIGSSPRLEVILEQVRAYRKNKREYALGAVAVALRAGQPDSMFERLPQFGISVEHGLQVQQDWKVYVEDAKGRRVRTDEDIELNIADMNLTDDVLETLREIGFITKNAAGADVIAGETIEDRHLTVARFFYEFYNTVAQREASVKDLYLSLGHWHAKDPLLADEAKFWKMISDVTTATTLSWTTALQNLLEIPLITELTGTRTMIQGMTKLFAQESREQLLDLAQGLSHAPRFMAETDLAEKYLGSYWSGFSITDKISRAAGLGVGLVNAKRKIKQYKETISEKQKAALRREFEEMALDVKVIDPIPTRGLDKLLDDAQELILSGQVTPKFGESATLTDKLAWTVLQHMHYISDATFKAYDATSLPPFLMKQTPLIRLFMKYKSWMFQHNSFKWKNWRRAVREAKAGNFVPLWNMAQSAAWSGATYGMLLAIYAAATGDDEPVDMIKGMHAAQTLGMSSVLLEMAARSDGNWWHLSRDMMGQAAGPVGSITSQTVAPMITGDWDVAGSQVQRRIPVINVFRRMGGFRLLEETFDAEE